MDGTLLFGPPLVGFGLQFALVQHLEFAAAFSALALGIIYVPAKFAADAALESIDSSLSSSWASTLQPGVNYP